MILFKLLNRRIIDEIHGCVSTGKEVIRMKHADTLYHTHYHTQYPYCEMRGEYQNYFLSIVCFEIQANVYHATNEAGEEFAIKVYKTSILIFKDRVRIFSLCISFKRVHSQTHNISVYFHILNLLSSKEFVDCQTSLCFLFL
jgi:RIO kinase 1